MAAMRESSGSALAVGRFAGWEPLGFEAGDNNWYRFVANGPTAKTDPGGLQQFECQCLVSGACDETPRASPSPRPLSPAAQEEFAAILDLAQQWYRDYKGPGWPSEDCWIQANALGVHLNTKGPWHYWEVTGVTGQRVVTGLSVPSGYFPTPLRWEAWNAIGLFPKGECSGSQSWVLDGFHGYDNSGIGSAMDEPIRVEVFRQRFPWGSDSFTPTPAR